MPHALYITIAILSVLFGAFVGRTCKTAANGPKQGMRNGGWALSIVTGLAFGAIAVCFSPASSLLACALGGALEGGVLFIAACFVSEKVVA